MSCWLVRLPYTNIKTNNALDFIVGSRVFAAMADFVAGYAYATSHAQPLTKGQKPVGPETQSLPWAERFPIYPSASLPERK